MNPDLQRALKAVHPCGRYAGMTWEQIFAIAPDPWLFAVWVSKNIAGEAGDRAAVVVEHGYGFPLERVA